MKPRDSEMPTMFTFHLRPGTALLFAALVLAGCSGGKRPSGVKGTGGAFVVLRTEPQNNGKLFLNEPIRIDFSNPVDLSTADLNTVSFAVFDLAGRPLAEQPAGTFRVVAAPGDAAPGRRLEFLPRFPTNDTYDNGGFRPGREYVVQLVGGDRRNANVLRDVNGRGLAQPVSFRFRTADGTTPAQLFRDTKAGGPRRVGFEFSPVAQTSSGPRAVLNLAGQVPIEIRLKFDQPLNPHSQNVPHRLDVDPTKRDIGKRGRIFLEYDDPDPTRGKNSWIPARVDLESNALEGAEVVLHPVGVLPNNALIRVIVENTLEDMAGESNVADASYNRVFATFRVVEAYNPQFDAIVENFRERREIDMQAPFLEPPAEIHNGFVRANFAFEGSSTILDYEPTTREVVLNTDFTQIVPKGAPPINVAGGVFSFRNVTIPAGVTVRGTGTRPMVWLVTGDFVVNGELTVSGGNGARVDTLNSANFPTAGGVGVCGGGNGGRGSPNTTKQSPKGEAGFGPGQVPGGGGGGGLLSCVTTCNRGSGGGGGSFATQGDPYYPVKAGANNSFIQQKGGGGFGCRGSSGAASRTLPGGTPGPVAFKDARRDNDFWGSAVDVNRQIRITGELLSPQGGAGGGGGGDRSSQCNNPNWISDAKGGGGGGGAGVLIIKALGTIRVGPSGQIRADGGHGGGGEQAGGNNLGGGGGGGSGGMVVLMAGRSIELHAHGGTYAQRDYDFSVSADGGVGTQGSFGGLSWDKKYPPPAVGSQWDNNPSGGFGGLGVVQLMAPPGQPDPQCTGGPDGTNTVLDDNIHIIQGTTRLTGAQKMAYLAWRGFPDDTGKFVDDCGKPTNIGDQEGDIRPAPILMPAPFGSQSKVRSKWIDTGATVRRALGAPDGAPRGVIESAGFKAGPNYFFAGTSTAKSSKYQGYVDYEQQSGGGITLKFPAVLGSPAPVFRITSQPFLGQPAYLVELATAALGSQDDRYAHYVAQLINKSGSVVKEYRILSHTARSLFLSTEALVVGDPQRDGALPADTDGLRLQVVAKFFQVRTDQAPGLGRTYTAPGGRQVPIANVRFGFAFHKDATKALSKGTDPNRFPQQVGTFTYDVNSPAAREFLRQLHAPYVKWEITFNTRFSEDAPNNTNPDIGLSPSNPRPEVHFLVLPTRF